MKSLLIIVSLCLFAHSSYTVAEVNFNKVGEARMEYLFWDIYDASLFTPTGVYQPGEHPIKFTLTYLRDFSAKDIVKATNEQWQHLGKQQLTARYADRLLALWPNINKGESLTLQTDQQGQSVFFHNGEKLGHIEDADFADQFLAIWLSEHTSEPKLRKQLLGEL